MKVRPWLLKVGVALATVAMAMIVIGFLGAGSNTPSTSNLPIQPIATTSPHCPGELETRTIGQTPIVINPEGRCIVKWGVDAPLKFINHSGASIIVGPQGGSYDRFWTESAQAATSQKVVLHYKLVTS
jgi:hypothetical protein